MNGRCNLFSIAWRIAVFGAQVVAAAGAAQAGDPARLDAYNVVWNAPSKDSTGSMPLGNGDLGVNAWVEPSGDLVMLLSKTDAWSENCRLLKLGRVRIKLSPLRWAPGAPFEQQLRLHEGEMTVRFGEGPGATRLRVWVDAHRPVVRVEADCGEPSELEATLEVWRTQEREIQGNEVHGVYGLEGGPEPILCYPDTVLEGQANRIAWYHRNEQSIWAANLRHQGLEALLEKLEDPLMHRTFGAFVEGDGLRNDGDTTLKSEGPQKRFAIGIHLHTAQSPTADAWLAALEKQVAATQQVPLEAARAAHRNWWQEFWNRSWIHASGGFTCPGLPDRLVHPMLAGRDQAGGHGFVGDIGRVSVLDRAATAEEITAWAAGARDPLQDEEALLGSWTALEPGTKLAAADQLCPNRSWTIEAWLRPEALPGGGARIVDAVTPGGADGLLLDTHPGNSLRLIAGRRTLNASNALPPGKWAHVAAVANEANGALTLYVNGQPAEQPPGDAEQSLDDGETVSRGYTLQRWINACAGRGVHPIKFNGTLFTVDMGGFDPDYRRWGGPYWWQNTRLPYWPMLACGDFEMLLPLFRMYEATLPLAEFRTQVWFGHGGAFFPETMYFWGMFTNSNYGWNRDNLPVGELTNRYIRREYTASPELMAMMLDYYDYTRDESFLEDRLLPLSDTLLKFWDEHYQRDENGRLVMYPAQALETLQDAKNPTPDVAGLDWVLGKLLGLSEQVTGAERRASWGRLRKSLPPLPMAGEEGHQWVLGAEQDFGGRGNSENPELYAVFPFRLYGVGKPGLEIGRRTFEKRAVRGNTGWRQDDTQAAFLGLADEAAKLVIGRAKEKHAGSRFPAFWGPNFDWIPDQDHGGNLMKALQTMLLQAEGDAIWLLPAWPVDWNVTFKLHAPRQTTVEGIYRDGKLEQLKVTPESRRKDVRVMLEGAGAG